MCWQGQNRVRFMPSEGTVHQTGSLLSAEPCSPVVRCSPAEGGLAASVWHLSIAYQCVLC